MKMKNGKKVFDNSTHIEGYLYSSKLEKKVTGENSKHPGTNYIAGSIDIATDEAMTNIVTINFTYETPTMGKEGQTENPRWAVLNQIIDGDLKTVLNSNKDMATKMRIDSRIGLNEYYSDKSGEVKLVSYKQNESGFIHINPVLSSDEKARATFSEDFLMVSMRILDADPERGLDQKGIISGYVFDFAGRLLPVDFSVTNAGAIDYFTGLDISKSNPVLTRVTGVQVNSTITTEKVEHGAFGDRVIPSTTSKRDWVITWTQLEPYEFDTEETLTKQELTDALAARKIVESTLKANYDARQAKAAVATPSIGGFDF